MSNSISDEYLDPEKEEFWYECYSCSWEGEIPYTQEVNLFDSYSVEESLTYLCPNCGSIIY